MYGALWRVLPGPWWVRVLILIVLHQRGHAVHELGRMGDRRAERLADRLVPEADPQERDAGISRRTDDGYRRAGVRRNTWTRRDEHAPVRVDRSCGIDDRVGLDEIRVGAELVEIPDEGVDEAVVVVDHEDGRVTHFATARGVIGRRRRGVESSAGPVSAPSTGGF